MKKLVVRLSLLGILASAYVIGLSAASEVARPGLIAYCCVAGDGRHTCCSYRGCSADASSCQNN